MGLRPGKPWAVMAGASEFGSGALMALGLLGPVGPISAYGPMITAWITAHAGKPIWSTSGGAEMPLLYMSNAAALALIGPGRFSLDRVLGIKVPAPVIGLTAAGVAAGIAATLIMREQPAEQEDGTGDAQAQSGEADANSSGGASNQAIETEISSAGETGDFQEQLAASEVGGDRPSATGQDNRGTAADVSGEAQ
jgi:putative oxidoreductase